MQGSVLNDRLRIKIREEIAGTYSPRAVSSASKTFPRYGYMSAGCVVDPPWQEKLPLLLLRSVMA